jgi:hypothetical protein
MGVVAGFVVGELWGVDAQPPRRQRRRRAEMSRVIGCSEAGGVGGGDVDV